MTGSRQPGDGAAPVLELRAGKRSLQLGERPWLMGIVNATPDSFSDAGLHPTLDARLQRARTLVEQGADIIDVGGESGITGVSPVDAADEIERVVPLIESISAELDAVVSVDTYKPAVAAAAIAAGATIVNDTSGLRYPELAGVCADTGAALVVMHTAAAPKQRRHDPGLYGDVVAEVVEFIAERIGVARAAGVAEQQLIVDPGPDFTKTPAQTIELLRHVEALHALGRPLLMAVSRKDFVGALTQRSPRGRLAGTLAALAHGIDRGAHIFRIHDVDAAADFIAVLGALRGEHEVDADLRLDDALRWEPVAGD